MSDQFDEIARYRKKSSRRPPPKAKHKHDFHPCVFEFDGLKFDKAHGFIPEPAVRIGSYCTVCGKVGSVYDETWTIWVPTNPCRRSGRIEYTEEAKRELNPATRTIPTFRLNDPFSQKFVLLQED